MDLDLFLNVDEPDLRLARVVSASDLSHLPLPTLTQGDTLNVSIYLVKRDGTYHPDSTSGTLSRTLSLGLPGQAALCSATSFTAITNGRLAVLPLTGDALALFVGSTVGLPLSLVFRTSGTAITTRCTLPATVTQAVVDETSTDSATITYSESTNVSGNTTIMPDTSSREHTEAIAFTGSAGTRIIILSTTDRVSADAITVLAGLPATADIVLEFRDATSTGALLLTRTTDASGDDLSADFIFTGTAWRYVRSTYPA